VPKLVAIQPEHEGMCHARQDDKLPVRIRQLAIKIQAVLIGGVFAARNENRGMNFLRIDDRQIGVKSRYVPVGTLSP